MLPFRVGGWPSCRSQPPAIKTTMVETSRPIKLAMRGPLSAWLSALQTYRSAAHSHASAVLRAVNGKLSHRRLHQGDATPAILRLLRSRPPATAIPNGQLDRPGSTRAHGDATSDLDVAPRRGQVGMIHNIRCGLADRQYQILDLSIRPPMRQEPLAQPFPDQRQRCRLRSQRQAERGRRLCPRAFLIGWLRISLRGWLMMVTWWRWHRGPRVPYPVPVRSLRQRLVDRVVQG